MREEDRSRAELSADLRIDGLLRGLALRDEDGFLQRVRSRLRKRRIAWRWAAAAALLVALAAAVVIRERRTRPVPPGRRPPVAADPAEPKRSMDEAAVPPARDSGTETRAKSAESERMPERSSVAEAAVAVVEIVVGEVHIVGPSGRERARPGRGLPRGTRIETDASEARVRLYGGASVEILANSEMRFGSEIRLARGRARVRATATEVRLATTDAEVRFVRAEGTVRVSDETRIDVTSGNVDLRRASDGEALRVPAGCYSIVGFGAEFEVRSEAAKIASIPVGQDAMISESEPERNYGSSPTLWVDGRAGRDGKDRAMLLGWDLSPIPRRSTILSVAIEVDVVDDGNGQAYGVYALGREWKETAATWRNSWSPSGGVRLGDLAPHGPGRFLVKLNRPGVERVQTWVDRTSRNFGFLIADSKRTNAVGIRSREAEDPRSHPKLIVAYLPPSK